MPAPAATLELTFHAPDELHDVLVADLDALGFEGFVQDDTRLLAYVPEARWDEATREAAEAVRLRYELPREIDVARIEDQNWNAAYEATLPVIVAPPFAIQPSWAALGPEHDGLTVLHIDPKMSFGTGMHESTRLVLGLLPKVVRPGDRVLDAGTGTGVLAIAALKLGAAHALTFDIDAWAEENAGENFARNDVSDRAEVRIGDLDVVPETGFDVTLANIHREVLLGMLPALAERTKPAGRLVLAGLLRTDIDAMRAAIDAAGFDTLHEAVENDWWAWAGTKRPAA